MANPFHLLWAAPLVAFLGYASHRASLCTVRAVADILETGRFERFGGFVRAVLWTMLLTLPALYFFPERFPAPTRSGPLWTGLIGGLLFGLGAALNKGCAFSTLQRLADADWRMLATLAGFVGGSAVSGWLPTTLLGAPPTPVMPQLEPWLLVALVVWAVVETVTLWRRHIGLRHLLHADPYSPAATALLLGLGAGILYLGVGSWTYMNSLQAAVGALVADGCLPSRFQFALIPALFAGMLVSAWQRGSWRMRQSWRGWDASLGGGILMGLGSTLIPGGNDTLLLRLIPSLTPDSLWIYLMLVAGVVAGLLLQRHPSGQIDAGCGGPANRAHREGCG
jgi:hypothetical protein